MHVMNLSFFLTVIYVCSGGIHGTGLYAMKRELLLISC